MRPPARRWTEIAAPAFGAGARDWIAVLPLAAVEQHGPHLPTGVDLMVAEAMVARVIARLPADSPTVFLPPMAVGKSDEHRAFPGTLTLGWQTAVQWLLDLGDSVHRAGLRKLVMVTSHGGNLAPMEIAARELRGRHGMLAVTTAWGRLRDAADLHDPASAPIDIHAGAAETAWMRAIRPDLVDMAEARDFASAQGPLSARGGALGYHGAKANIAWLAQDLNPAGPVGNAAAARADQGAEDLDRMAEGFLRLLAEIATQPPPAA